MNTPANIQSLQLNIASIAKLNADTKAKIAKLNADTKAKIAKLNAENAKYDALFKYLGINPNESEDLYKNEDFVLSIIPKLSKLIVMNKQKTDLN